MLWSKKKLGNSLDSCFKKWKYICLYPNRHIYSNTWDTQSCKNPALHMGRNKISAPDLFPAFNQVFCSLKMYLLLLLLRSVFATIWPKASGKLFLIILVFFVPLALFKDVTSFIFLSSQENIWRCHKGVWVFSQALTHLSLVLLHLVFISVNLPQQIFNSLVAELVPFAAALVQLSHLSHQKRGDLGRGEGWKQELNRAEIRMSFRNLIITLAPELDKKNLCTLRTSSIGIQPEVLLTAVYFQNFQGYPFLIPVLTRPRLCCTTPHTAVELTVQSRSW